MVLIAGVSFAGYVAIRLLGARSGTLLTGVFGGLVSSTAVALSLAARAREPQAGLSNLAAGIVVASSMMFWRCALVVGAIDFSLGVRLAWPLGIAGAIGMAGGALLARRGGTSGAFVPQDPTALRTAVQFGLLLAVVEFLAAALRHWAGDEGLFVLAGISGLADVDAISLSIAGMSGLDATVAAGAIVLAAAANTLVKIAIVTLRGSSALGWRVGLPLAAALAGGAVALAVPAPWPIAG